MIQTMANLVLFFNYTILQKKNTTLILVVFFYNSITIEFA